MDARRSGSRETERNLRLLTVAEAAEMLHTTVWHMRSLVAERRIAHYRVGRKLRLSEADLTAFLQQNRVEGQP